MSKVLIQIHGADTCTVAELIAGLQLAHGFTRAEAGRVVAWLVDNDYIQTANFTLNNPAETVPNAEQNPLY